MKLSTDELKFLSTFFADKPVNRAFLFGSYARNEADQKSDIDILVELDYSKHIGLGFITMQQEIEKALKKKVDLVTQSSLSKYIYPFVDSEKQLIYERH